MSNYDVGLKVVEAVASGPRSLQDPSKRNIGLLGQFVRGASFRPVRIESMEEFNTIFGGQSSSFYGPGIVRSIFKEAGNAPVILYLARVTGVDAVAATASVNTEEAKTMIVTAGYKGSDDVGAWANGLKAYLYSFSSYSKGNFTFVVEYNGDTEVYSYPSLAEIQAAVNTVSKYVTVLFSAEISKNNFAPLSGALTSSLSSKTVTAATLYAWKHSDDVLYTLAEVPEANDVVYSAPGVAAGVVTSYDAGTGITVDEVAYAYTVGENLVPNLLTGVSAGTVLFSGNDVLGTVISVESNSSLTLVNTAFKVVTSGSIIKRVDTVYEATLASGDDGNVSESDFYSVYDSVNPKGFACFDGVDVQIIASTEFHSLTLASNLKAYLENRRDPIGLVNLPLNADEGTAELWSYTLQSNDVSFLAGYLGWAKVYDDNGYLSVIPIIGPVLGAAYLRTPYQYGDLIHIPPGGIDSTFVSVADVIPQRVSQSMVNSVVKDHTCNVIRYLEGYGYYVGSSRSYSVNSLYQSIHIRIQTSYYKRLMDARLKFWEQKPNTPENTNAALAKLYSMFSTEYNVGALERSIPFEQAYQVVQVKTTDRKFVSIKVLWIPTECTEGILVSLERNDGILNITE